MSEDTAWAGAGAGLTGASRREFIVGAGMTVTAIAAAVLAEREADFAPALRSDIESIIPAKVGAWQRSAADGILIPTAEQSDRIYDDVVTRYYTSDTKPAVMLLIAYGSAQNGTAQLHRPETCYPAAGFRLRDWPDVALSLSGVTVPARVMTATAPGRTEQILYWSRIGREFPTTGFGQHWAVFRSTMSGIVPDGILVRMSVIDPDRREGVSSLREFAASLIAASPPDLQLLLTGRAQ